MGAPVTAHLPLANVALQHAEERRRQPPSARSVGRSGIRSWMDYPSSKSPSKDTLNANGFRPAKRREIIESLPKHGKGELNGAQALVFLGLPGPTPNWKIWR